MSLSSTVHLFSSIAITSNPWVYSGLRRRQLRDLLSHRRSAADAASVPSKHASRLVPSCRHCSACHLMNVNRIFLQYPIRTFYFVQRA